MISDSSAQQRQCLLPVNYFGSVRTLQFIHSQNLVLVYVKRLENCRLSSEFRNIIWVAYGSDLSKIIWNELQKTLPLDSQINIYHFWQVRFVNWFILELE